ncbi:MAG: CHAT domain-containing protein [Burkholderiales bacterium]|nr:CHAT domain-containing protein [Burkholderiales bacterium]
MSVQLLVPGQPEPISAQVPVARSGADSSAAAPTTDLLDSVEIVQAFDLSPTARSAATSTPARTDLQDDDILEIQVEDGFTLWTSAAHYQERVRALDPEATSGEAVIFSTVPQPSQAERGIKEWIGSGLRVLRLKPDRILEEMKDPRNWPALIRNLGQGKLERLGSWATAKVLMHLIEKRLTPGPGLYRWAGGDGAGPAPLEGAAPVGAAELPAATPLLIFIHGTASRTTSSFGAFAEPGARMHWQSLTAQFGRHVYAFEHRTLSDSPVDNAVDLLETLPVGAQLCLISHSRGGLVGDLLCLTGLSAQQIERFVEQRRLSGDADAAAHDRSQLQRLAQLLKDKQPRVLAYARVACPARGTLLASENIDDFLSILTNLISLIPGLGTSAIYQVIKRVTLEVVKRRMQPSLIPGIEAMVPESPLIALLNTAAKSADRLGVIAGDIEGGNWLKRLGVFITDRFIYEGHDNDLVVNTDSMFYGARREAVWYVFDQGSRVTHFNYFRNEGTRGAVVGWVLARDLNVTPEGFVLLDRPVSDVVPTLRAIQRRSGAAQPVVFVLPGIMGSKLERRGNVIWLDYVDLAIGGLGRIRDVDDREVIPVGLIENFYGDLCRYLSDTHEVIPFAYDWRNSVRAAATRLASEVDKTLKRTDQPVRFVAHSMGGLVMRALIAQRPDLWAQVCARDGGRLVMLGTPNRGSHAMAGTLLGVDRTVRMLALLDQFHSTQNVLDIVARFHGALELLPQIGADERDWFLPSLWGELRKINRNLGAIPTTAFLDAAKDALAGLPVDIPNADRVVYVAGSAPSTACGVDTDQRGRLRMITTDQGDGRVTYECGKLPGVAMWYAPAVHGDLASHTPAFPAIQQLLTDGRTALLPTQPPAGARGVRSEMPLIEQPVLYPTEEDLLAGWMGGSGARRHRRREQAQLKVSVVHGDLQHARYPVMVGHYEGDTIGGAEGYLDRRLKGALSQRYDLGLYPGALGSNIVVLREPNTVQKALGVPRGAIVIGLGRMGELAPATLANSVRQGVLAYITQLDDRSAAAAADEHPIGLSVLLIGANSTANITVHSSVNALLRGITQANQELAPLASTGRRYVSEVEIVELYADTAILAQHALRSVAVDVGDELEARIDFEPLLREGRGGKVRVLPSTGADQWRRWIISARPAAQPAAAPELPGALAQRMRDALREPTQVDADAWKAVLDIAFGTSPTTTQVPLELDYVALSDRARAEKRAQQGQPQLIDTLVQISIRDTQFKLDSARTLFELLIPNELKDVFTQQGRLVMVVDQATANYPWELMAVGARPVCVDMGLVRQLQTTQFRPQIRASTVNTAYVVGDPLTSDTVPPLPAAREEAQLVAALLSPRFQVTYNPERATALEVLDGLFAQPYRILHLAGHGWYDASGGGGARSGMLLEGGLYLTAAEIGQMRQVPDLVFLNCCHLGQVGAEAAKNEVAFNRLAASISRELIEMGVRAVVAAGWAVRDDAANFFAQSFYQQMLGGAAFGAALLQARLETWRRFPDCNTSGAYQAYGDPDFRLDTGGADEEARARSRQQPLVAPQELLERLAGQHDPKELEKLLGNVPPVWLQRADVLTAAAKACRDAGMFQRAIELYRTALSSEACASEVTLEAVEALGNLEVRWGERSRQPAMIESGIARLEQLLAVGETSERLALLGSAWKRRAQIADDDVLRDALEHCADYYRRASERLVVQGDFDPYPALNWLTVDILLGRAPADGDAWLARVNVAARQRFERTRSVWDAIAIPDAQLLVHLLHGTLGADGVDAQLASLYVAAVDEAQANDRQRDSITNQLAFIQDTGMRLAKGKSARWGAVIGDLHAALQKAWDKGDIAGTAAKEVKATALPVSAAAQKKPVRPKKSRSPKKAGAPKKASSRRKPGPRQ